MKNVINLDDLEDERLDEKQFTQLYTKLYLDQKPRIKSKTEKNIIAAANFFDRIDTDNKGYILIGDLKRAAQFVHFESTHENLEDMFAMICREDENNITKAQFVDFFTDFM